MNGDGMMDKGPAINGRKFLIFTIGGLFLFTLVSMVVTLTIGRVFGKVLNKKAMQHEREIDTQVMRDKESNLKH
jgi:hypothetical protein